jgi:hypothetical protein
MDIEKRVEIVFTVVVYAHVVMGAGHSTVGSPREVAGRIGIRRSAVPVGALV